MKRSQFVDANFDGHGRPIIHIIQRRGPADVLKWKRYEVDHGVGGNVHPGTLNIHMVSVEKAILADRTEGKFDFILVDGPFEVRHHDRPGFNLVWTGFWE